MASASRRAARVRACIVRLGLAAGQYGVAATLPPVLCPNLDYGDLEVQDGTSAMESWERMINAEPEESEEIAEALLKYCERDTFAMVEIYRFLITI